MNLSSTIGLGVAGNFTGHLEQAGEAGDFANVVVKDEQAPKGLFPFYVPSKTGSFLETNPLSSTEITLPESGVDIQIEPEVAIICSVEYDGEKVARIAPQQFAAYNDCSIRKPGAKKISEKKNWGSNSKGISDQRIAIDTFSSGGAMDAYRITCYFLRDGELHEYGVNSPVNGYSYFNQQLIDWIVEKMNTQEDASPLESIPTLIKQSGFPSQTIISIGATRYTDFGEKTFLKTDDECFVIVYNADTYDLDRIEQMCKTKEFPNDKISALHQHVH